MITPAQRRSISVALAALYLSSLLLADEDEVKDDDDDAEDQEPSKSDEGISEEPEIDWKQVELSNDVDLADKKSEWDAERGCDDDDTEFENDDDNSVRNDDGDNTPFLTENDGGTGHDGKEGN